jgi:hypothetical protein
MADLLRDLRQWRELNEYESVQQFKGCLSYQNAINGVADGLPAHRRLPTKPGSPACQPRPNAFAEGLS